MIIDVHTHIMTMWGDEKPFTERHLVKRMGELGIDRFVILPIVSQECPYFYFGSEDVLNVYRRHRKKVIPFCNIDPRAGRNSPETDFLPLLNRYKKAGCKGLGEVMANIYFDSPLSINLFRQCGKVGLPVLFHIHTKIGGSYGLVDDLHIPRLERALKKCPETIFIGHSQTFWSEISGDVTEETRGHYPKEPVSSGGRVQKLFKRYPNLYADLSAGSGYNAITRDMDYGYKFLEEFQDKLMFGTDLCHIKQETPIVDYFKDIKEKKIISKSAYEKITHKNAEKILNL
jgi:uncharacterized protein